MPRVNPSRNPRYTWSIIAIILVVIIISAFAAFIYHIKQDAPREDTGFVHNPSNTTQPKTAP